MRIDVLTKFHELWLQTVPSSKYTYSFKKDLRWSLLLRHNKLSSNFKMRLKLYISDVNFSDAKKKAKETTNQKAKVEKAPLGPTVKPVNPFDPDADCKRLYESMDGLGTNEDMIIDIIPHRCNKQRQDLKLYYQDKYNKVINTSLYNVSLLIDLNVNNSNMQDEALKLVPCSYTPPAAASDLNSMSRPFEFYIKLYFQSQYDVHRPDYSISNKSK